MSDQTPEVASDADTVEFHGRRFRIGQSVGLMPLLRFAKAASSGLDSADIEGMVAMYDLLSQCIADDEWAAFQAHATAKRVDGEALFAVTKQVMTLMSERPTRRPSGASDGLLETPQSSTDASTSRVVRRLEGEGRPDLALLVSDAAKARAS